MTEITATLQKTLEKQKFRRASRPKTKSGCYTCKKRRLKCDESKPGCVRCITKGFICDGYPGQVSKSARDAVLKPRTQLLTRSNPSQTLPLNETEGRYFQYFRESTLPRLLLRYFPSSFWSSIVLQESHFSETTRRAILAIGGLSKVMEIEGLPADLQTVLGHHHQFAIQQYTLAVKTFRQVLAEGDLDLPIALAICLLLMCFEGISGNHGAVITHLLSGIKLLQISPRSGKPKKSACVAQLHDSRLTELRQIFARLSIQSMFREYPLCRVDRFRISTVKMPAKFYSVAEALSEWDFLLSSIVDLYQRSLRQSDIKSNKKLYQDIVEEHGYYKKELQMWYAAFSDIAQQPNHISTDVTSISIMRLYHKYITILLVGVLQPCETVFDEYTDIFRDMLNLAVSILDTRPPCSDFSLDGGVILPLCLVATKCRVADIRCRAISTLGSRKWRECSWESSIAFKHTTWLMGIEEEGRDAKGFIPPHWRLKLPHVTADLEAGWTGLQVEGTVPGPDGKILYREVIMPW